MNEKKQTVWLDVGCGPNKKNGYIGVDVLQVAGVDVVVDLDKEGLPYPDGSVDKIYSSHFLEHVADPVRTLKEFIRVLKTGGHMQIIVPHYSNPYAYHFTHKTFWSSYSFGQEYTNYYLGGGINLISRKIRFVSFWPLENICSYIANRHTSLYERLLSSVVKAWDIEFVLEKVHIDQKESLSKKITLS